MSSLEWSRQGLRESRNPPREEAYALDAEVKIKLPCRYLLRVVTVLVGECESYLDDFEQVHVTSHSLVVVVGGSLEGAYWSRDNTWKFSVLDEAWKSSGCGVAAGRLQTGVPERHKDSRQ
jgi:hypothetical protein